MKLRRVGGALADKIPIDMTPMIDIVFQLLAFFIMTLKVISNEGDFSVKMPLAAMGSPSNDLLPPITIRLIANSDGSLQSIRVGERNMQRDLDALRAYVIDFIGGANSTAREEAEVEIDADHNLRYEYVIGTLGKVTGYVGPDGKMVPLVEKVKFAQPRVATE